MNGDEVTNGFVIANILYEQALKLQQQAIEERGKKEKAWQDTLDRFASALNLFSEVIERKF